MADVKQTLDGWINYSSPKLGTFLTRTWKNQQQALTYKEIREAIFAGQLDPGYLAQWQQDYSRFIIEGYAPLAQQAIDSAAQQMVAEHGIGAKSLNYPLIDSFISNHGGTLIREVSEEQYKAINVLVRQASFTETMDVKELAKAIRPTVGLTTRQAQAAYNRYQQAIADGYNEDKAREIQAKYAERLHRVRAETIAITEMAYAYNYGQQAYMEQCIRDGLIGGAQKKWMTAFDERVCEVCGKIDGEVVEMEANFSIGVLVPPAHPRCRCVVNYINVLPPTDWVDTTTSQPAAPSQQTPDQMLGETKYGYTPDQRKEIADLITNGETDEVRKLWKQSSGDLESVKQTCKAGEGFYHPVEKRVYFRVAEDVAGSSHQNPYALRFHEYGHNIDYLQGERVYGGAGFPSLSSRYVDPVTGKTITEAVMQESRAMVQSHYDSDRPNAIINALVNADNYGRSSSANVARKWTRDWMTAQGMTGRTKAGKALMQELDAAIANGYGGMTDFFTVQHPEIGQGLLDSVLAVKTKGGKSGLIDDFCRSMRRSLTLKERADISDMFEPFAVQYGVDYPFGVGHGKSYARGGAQLSTEAFAEMFSASFAQKESLAQIKTYYPEAYRIFLDMIRSVLTP